MSETPVRLFDRRAGTVLTHRWPRPLTARKVRPVSYPARSTLEPPDYDGHFVMIPLSRGKFALVDEADAELVLNGGKWTAWQPGSGRTWYAERHRSRPVSVTTHMHVLIAGCKGADHVNRNGLDNRRINLRPATYAQNGANRALLRNNTSGYKGVHWDRRGRKWRAQIKVNDRSRYLGLFTDPVDAARAYNRAAMEAFGEFAWLNPVPQPDPVDPDLTLRLARTLMEFPRARHQESYLAWRAGVKAGELRLALLGLLSEGLLEEIRERDCPSRRYYTMTDTGKDYMAGLLAA